VPGLRPPSPRSSWGRTYEAALEAVISVVLTIFGGYYADRYFGTEPVFLLIGLVLGGIAAVRRLLQIGPGSSSGPDTHESASPPESASADGAGGRRPEGSARGGDPGHDDKVDG